MKKNGSPEPRFNTDDDRTFFEVELFIHLAFKTIFPFTTDLKKLNWNMDGINELLNLILENAEINKAGVIAGDIANDIASGMNDLDNQVREISANTVVDITDDIAFDIVRKLKEIFCI